jgi:hypothetical protein
LPAKIAFDISLGLAGNKRAGRGREESPGGQRITQRTMGKGVMIPFQDIIKLKENAGICHYGEADGIRSRVIVPKVNTTPARVAEVA